MMTPKQIVQKRVDAFNIRDVEALGDLYIETAINHQVIQNQYKVEIILKNFADEFAKAEMICIIENIFEDQE